MGPNFPYSQLQHYPHQAQAMQMSQTPLMPQSPMMQGSMQGSMQGPMQGPMYPMRVMSSPGAAMSPYTGPEGMMMHQQVNTKNIQL